MILSLVCGQWGICGREIGCMRTRWESSLTKYGVTQGTQFVVSGGRFIDVTNVKMNPPMSNFY